MQHLRANTEVIVTVGPFVDVGDGFTPQTDITLGGDEAELIKRGSTAVVSISAATWAAVTSCRGYYSLTLTTSHTDTEGLLVVIVQDDSDTLPVKQEYMVLSEAAWDSLYAEKDTGFMDVNVPSAAVIADAVWDEALAGHVAAGSYGLAVADIETDATAILADTNELQSDDVPGLIAALNDPTAAVIADAVWDEALAGHLGSGSSGEALDNVSAGASPSAIADAVWDEALAGHLGSGSSGEALDNVSAGASPSAIADAVWDEAAAGHVASGSMGESLSEAADKTGHKLAADGVDLVVIEAGINLRQANALGLSALAGKLSGADTTTVTIKGAGNSTTRILATVDSSGNRSSMTLTPPA